MILKELINRAVFATISTIKDDTTIQKLNRLMPYNYAFIDNFEHIVVAINYFPKTPYTTIAEYKKAWLDNFPRVHIIDVPENKGHMFGTIHLEETILQYIKKEFPSKKYLFKSMDDVITSNNLLETTVPQADFYYLPGFSCESIIKAGSKSKLQDVYETHESGFWTPQTTFFILNIDDIDLLYGNDIDDKHSVYQEQKKISPNIKPWEISFDIKFDCETHLGRTVKNKTKYCLIANKFSKLLDLVEQVPIWDPSHKNVLFTDIGVCHYHYYTSPVYEV
jgi:hypothetical protein